MEGFKIISHTIPCALFREYPRATANSEEDILHIAVKQYIPLDNPNPQPGDITIIAAHACAFTKELYEPLWEELLAKAKDAPFRIRSIWMADVAWQGESYALNENVAGNDPGWFDHVRDLMNLINIKRDEMPRPIFGVGHSMGGAQIVKLALDHPSLFTSVILIDPVIQRKSAELVPGEKSNPAKMSTFRRDVWPSREEARKSFEKSAYYKVWDPRVLDRWVKYGLRDCPNAVHPDAKAPQVSLATPTSQEVFSFLRPNYEGYGVAGKLIDRHTHADLDPTIPNQFPFYRYEPIYVHGRLPELRPSCFFIFGGTSFTSDASMNEQKVAITGTGVGGSGGIAEARVTSVTLDGVGHLVAMEAPNKTAEYIAGWIGVERAIFLSKRRKLEEWWRKPLEEKQKIDEKWINAMGGHPKKKATESSKL